MNEFLRGFGRDDAFGLLRHAATAFGPLIAANGLSRGDAMTLLNATETIIGAVVAIAGVIASLGMKDKRDKRETRRRERARLR